MYNDCHIQPPRIVIVGPKKTGKTYLAIQLSFDKDKSHNDNQVSDISITSTAAWDNNYIISDVSGPITSSIYQTELHNHLFSNSIMAIIIVFNKSIDEEYLNIYVNHLLIDNIIVVCNYSDSVSDMTYIPNAYDTRDITVYHLRKNRQDNSALKSLIQRMHSIPTAVCDFKKMIKDNLTTVNGIHTIPAEDHFIVEVSPIGNSNETSYLQHNTSSNMSYRTIFIDPEYMAESEYSNQKQFAFCNYTGGGITVQMKFAGANAILKSFDIPNNNYQIFHNVSPGKCFDFDITCTRLSKLCRGENPEKIELARTVNNIINIRVTSRVHETKFVIEKL
mmetsp:Transcript_15439/g.13974  ORF Transcript_15439/g.13974 Transcript_15439/m.13974 type:complete len:334 (-) Transcript_15439:10-1011(-)